MWDRLTATAEPSNGYEEILIILTDSRHCTIWRVNAVYFVEAK